jgi:hypothetical protein
VVKETKKSSRAFAATPYPEEEEGITVLRNVDNYLQVDTK